MTRQILDKLKIFMLKIRLLTPNARSFRSFRPPVLGQLGTQQLVIVEGSTLPLRMALTGTGATQTATETRILRYGQRKKKN